MHTMLYGAIALIANHIVDSEAAAT